MSTLNVRDQAPEWRLVHRTTKQQHGSARRGGHGLRDPPGTPPDPQRGVLLKFRELRSPKRPAKSCVWVHLHGNRVHRFHEILKKPCDFKREKKGFMCL